MVERFDPTKPVEARWTLISVDDAAPSADDLKEFRKESAKRPVPGYCAWRILRNDRDHFNRFTSSDGVSFCRSAQGHREGDGQ